VVIVESDKADMDVESFYEGYVATILVPAGEAAPVGAPIALVAETEAEIETAQQQANSGGAAQSRQKTLPPPGQMADISATVETPDSDTPEVAESPNGNKEMDE